MPRSVPARRKPARRAPVARAVRPAVAAAPVVGNLSDVTYHAYLETIQARITRMLATGAPVFLTDVAPSVLWDTYLAGFVGAERQHHNCTACRHFLKAYGSAVTVDGDGVRRALLWNALEAPPAYRVMAGDMQKLVEGAPIARRLLVPTPTVGQPVTGDWRHYAMTLPASIVHTKTTPRDAAQECANTKANVEQVERCLQEFAQPVLDEAVTILQLGGLDRADKVLAAATWLRDLGAQVRALPRFPDRQNNILWREVAQAPDGFCHPRSSMLGVLLDELTRTSDYAAIRARWADKMRPDTYQRPTAAPKAGTIDQAEKLFAEMGLAPALKRRLATVEECERWWNSPSALPATSGGVFASLRTAPGRVATIARAMGGQRMTWTRFTREVLPSAQDIALRLPPVGSYGAVTTAVDPQAPTLFRWPHSFGHYMFSHGSNPEHWALRQGAIVRVLALSHRPCHWQGHVDSNPACAFLHLEGAVPVATSPSLFKETLKADLHSVSRVIEAFNNTGTVEPAPAGPLAAGYFIQSTQANAVLEVSLGGGRHMTVTIDQWD